MKSGFSGGASAFDSRVEKALAMTAEHEFPVAVPKVQKGGKATGGEASAGEASRGKALARRGKGSGLKVWGVTIKTERPSHWPASGYVDDIPLMSDARVAQEDAVGEIVPASCADSVGR